MTRALQVLLLLALVIAAPRLPAPRRNASARAVVEETIAGPPRRSK
jgi:hypothetical protein